MTFVPPCPQPHTVFELDALNRVHLVVSAGTLQDGLLFVWCEGE